MTEKEYESIHTHHCGVFLNFTAKTEYFITQILIDYCKYHPNRVTEPLKRIYTNEYTSFDTRKKEFFRIVKAEHPEFIKINPRLFSDIERLSNWRNLIAHSPIIFPKKLRAIRSHELKSIILGSLRIKGKSIIIEYHDFSFGKHENSVIKLFYVNEKLQLLMLKMLPQGKKLSYMMTGKALSKLE